MNKWIHIKDRIPERGAEVLIYDQVLKQIRISYLDPEQYQDDPELNNKYVWYEQGFTNEIFYWMPLPELPDE